MQIDRKRYNESKRIAVNERTVTESEKAKTKGSEEFDRKTLRSIEKRRKKI